MSRHYSDEFWMHYAFMLAKIAEEKGEVPVGAVLVLNEKIIGNGWNQSIVYHDPTAHAEIIALRQGGRQMNNYRLLNTTMYVTLEPCLMCVGAMIHARIDRLVFGAFNEKIGVAGSLLNVFSHTKINHQIVVTGGVLTQLCSDQLSTFFRHRRKQKICNLL